MKNSSPAFPLSGTSDFDREKGMSIRTFVSTEILASMVTGKLARAASRRSLVIAAVKLTDALLEELEKGE